MSTPVALETPTRRTLPLRTRILFLKLAAAGDMLLCTPALRALRQRYPEATLDVLTTATGANLLQASPLVDRCIVLDKYAFDYPRQILRHPHRLAALAPQLAALRFAHYDAVVLAHHLTLPFGRLKYRLLLAATGAPVRVGLDNGYGVFLTDRVGDGGFGAQHEADYMQAVAASLDASLAPGERDIRLADLGWSEIEAWRPPSDPFPTIALHVGSGGYSLARRWPPDAFATVARALHDDYGTKCALIGGAEEAALHATVLARLGWPAWARSLAGQQTPREMAQFFSQCALLIANDSFPMHLAAAVGLPVVAIFGPTNADAWGPYAPHFPERVARVRRDDLPCSPCIYRGHALGAPEGCPPRPCLTNLQPTRVLAAARRLLRTMPPPAGDAQDG